MRIISAALCHPAAIKDSGTTEHLIDNELRYGHCPLCNDAKSVLILHKGQLREVIGTRDPLPIDIGTNADQLHKKYCSWIGLTSNFCDLVPQHYVCLMCYLHR